MTGLNDLADFQQQLRHLAFAHWPERPVREAKISRLSAVKCGDCRASQNEDEFVFRVHRQDD